MDDFSTVRDVIESFNISLTQRVGLDELSQRYIFLHSNDDTRQLTDGQSCTRTNFVTLEAIYSFNIVHCRIQISSNRLKRVSGPYNIGKVSVQFVIIEDNGLCVDVCASRRHHISKRCLHRCRLYSKLEFICVDDEIVENHEVKQCNNELSNVVRLSCSFYLLGGIYRHEKDKIVNGGERGIRTHGPRKGTTVFKTVAFNRSAISPLCLG